MTRPTPPKRERPPALLAKIATRPPPWTVAVTMEYDIFYVMIAQGLLIPALIVLGANIWTTNDNALYTSGLGLPQDTRLPTKAPPATPRIAPQFMLRVTTESGV